MRRGLFWIPFSAHGLHGPGRRSRVGRPGRREVTHIMAGRKRKRREEPGGEKALPGQPPVTHVLTAS